MKRACFRAGIGVFVPTQIRLGSIAAAKKLFTEKMVKSWVGHKMKEATYDDLTEAVKVAIKFS